MAPRGIGGGKNSTPLHFLTGGRLRHTKPGLCRFCFVSWCRFLCLLSVFQAYVMLGFFVFSCQYHCNWLPGKTHLRNDLLRVEWDVKPYTLTH